MSLLTMKLVPDPILRQQAKKINPIPQSLGKYTDDMIETMHDERGVGLAANQVGSLRKVAVIQLPEWDEALVLINPEIIRREGEREVEEGQGDRREEGEQGGHAQRKPRSAADMRWRSGLRTWAVDAACVLAVRAIACVCAVALVRTARAG